MKRLNYACLEEIHSTDYRLKEAPERILQFGEGNFLRGFVDYFIDVLNEERGFNSKVVVVQPIKQGLAEVLNEQEGLYTLYLRGYENGEAVNKRRLISSISRAINPYEESQAFLDQAKNPDLRFIVSNTTEAGIAYVSADKLEDTMPSSFPAKLTKLMYERFKTFGTEKGKGFIILSCELIEHNGAELKKCVLKYAESWQLPEAFKAWIEEENTFCSTLVDRIVTGYPRNEAEALCVENGYQDKLLDTAEVFGFWVIEGPQSLYEELPIKDSGLPILVTDDHTPYKKRKVGILNGAHTSMVLAAYLAGENIVRECMHNEVIEAFMEHTLFEEIIPTLPLKEEELISFANATIERFKNPFIDHQLLAICLNSVSKWKARVLPSMKGYIKKYGKLPSHIVFSFAALMAFYTGSKIEDGALIGHRQDETYKIVDDTAVLEYCAKCSETLPIVDYVKGFASREDFFGEDLTKYEGFVEAVTAYLTSIRQKGMKQVLEEVAKGK